MSIVLWAKAKLYKIKGGFILIKSARSYKVAAIYSPASTFFCRRCAKKSGMKVSAAMASAT